MSRKSRKLRTVAGATFIAMSLSPSHVIPAEKTSALTALDYIEIQQLVNR